MFYLAEDYLERWKRTGEIGRFFTIDEILAMSSQEKVKHFSLELHRNTSFVKGAEYFHCNLRYRIGNVILGHAILYVGLSRKWFNWDEFYPVGKN